MQQVSLSVGDTLVVFLEGNATTGYTWTAPTVPKCLIDKGQTSTPRSALIGAPSAIQWRFQATKVCDPSPLILRYGRSWDPATWVYHMIVVNVKNNKTMPKQVRIQGPSGTQMVNEFTTMQ